MTKPKTKTTTKPKKEDLIKVARCAGSAVGAFRDGDPEQATRFLMLAAKFIEISRRAA